MKTDLNDRQKLIVKATRDTPTFCEVFRPKVDHPLRGIIEYHPHAYQRTMMRSLDKGKKVCVLKSRQTGISTTVMIQKLRRSIQPGVTTLIVSRKQDAAKDLIRRARDAYKSCDPQFPVKLTGDNALALTFENGSRIIAEASSPETGRTYAASDLVLDELAFMPWQDEMWRSLRPTITGGGSVCAVSTPDMEGDRFHQLWMLAESSSEWTAQRIHWSEHPEYGQEWFDKNRPDYTQAEWAQEFECEFGHASDAVFASGAIEDAIERGREPWNPPENPIWCEGWDIAGEGSDCSVGTVVEASQNPLRLVDVRSWEVLPAPRLQAEIELLAADYPCKPWVLQTGIGWGIAQNVTVPIVPVTETGGTQVTGKHWEPRIPRVLLINNLVKVMEQGGLAIPERMQETIMGLKSYRWEKRKGRNADHVDSLAVAVWAATNGRVDVSTWGMRIA